VGIYQNPPKVFINEQGQPDGFFVDLLSALSPRLQVKFDYVEVTWPEGLDDLADGKIDLLVDVVSSPSRQEDYELSKVAVLENWATLYIHEKEEPSYYTLQDLPGKTIAVMQQDNNYAAFKARLAADSAKVRFIEVVGYPEVLQAVAQGKADMGLVNCYFGKYYSHKLPVQEVSILVNPSTIHFAGTKPKTAELIGRIDRELHKLKQDEESVYYDLINRWLAAPNFFVIPKWLNRLLAFAAVLFFAITVITIFLVLKLKQRKRELQVTNWHLKKEAKEKQVYQQELIRQNEELVGTNKELDGLIQEKTQYEEVLQHQNEELVNTNKELDHLIYQISHNLRAPVASSLGLIGISWFGGAEEVMPMIQERLLGLDSTIADIMDYYQNMHIGVKPVELAVEELVEEVFEQLKPLHQYQVELHQEYALQHPLVTDEYRFRTILHNLMSNSIKFKNLAADDAAFVRVKIASDLQQLQLVVEDNGIGILANQQQKVFEMFYRATNQGGGAGLGLYIAQRMAINLGGKISLASAPGRGTVASLVLPNLHEPERTSVAELSDRK
jgi:signal transduction histidine kinase